LRSIRILIVTHALLSAELGAGQMAFNLAEALRAQGHDVTLWSPYPLPSQTRWWQSIQQMRSKLDEFIETQEPFDVIDNVTVLITKQVTKSAVVVARSVQPDILYLAHSLNSWKQRSRKEIFKLPFSYLYVLFQVFLLLQGWQRAKYILCLGTLELEWMKKWFPWWRCKLISYFNALSNVDQEALAQVRTNRQSHLDDAIRFLWIGRWVSHKGITELLDFIVERAALCLQDTFTIAGCGTDAEKDCPPQLLQSGRLKILPSFKRSQLYSLLASHDVGLFTSRVEGWGLVLNEMLESGMPVFATPVGGVPDLQAFVKDMLKPFPPPSKSTNDILTTSTNLKDYYSTFTWEKIAKVYTNLIFANLEPKSIPIRQHNEENYTAT